jgi:hypothetical protein
MVIEVFDGLAANVPRRKQRNRGNGRREGFYGAIAEAERDSFFNS